MYRTKLGIMATFHAWHNQCIVMVYPHRLLVAIYIEIVSIMLISVLICFYTVSLTSGYQEMF